jgi:hypothetical protein
MTESVKYIHVTHKQQRSASKKFNCAYTASTRVHAFGTVRVTRPGNFIYSCVQYKTVQLKTRLCKSHHEVQ